MTGTFVTKHGGFPIYLDPDGHYWQNGGSASLDDIRREIDDFNDEDDCPPDTEALDEPWWVHE
jgi:hypothetical protein